jgi:hypothetical protein
MIMFLSISLINLTVWCCQMLTHKLITDYPKVRGIFEGSLLLHLVGLSFPANSDMLACRKGPLMSIITGNIDGLTNTISYL